MAKCDICEKDMLRAKGCIEKDYIIDGERYPAIPHIAQWEGEERCHDCNAKEGEPHHTGCDNEDCPCCGMQFIGCDCDVSERIIVFPKGRKKEVEK
jgi:hypothetical protein